jgi:hypothetical protein
VIAAARITIQIFPNISELLLCWDWERAQRNR